MSAIVTVLAEVPPGLRSVPLLVLLLLVSCCCYFVYAEHRWKKICLDVNFQMMENVFQLNFESHHEQWTRTR